MSKTLRSTKEMSKDNIRQTTNLIIVHCSDSTWGCANVVTAWHNAREINPMGYHYLINNGKPNALCEYKSKWDGKIEVGRPEEFVGAHAKGYNYRSIGICLIGKHHFTLQQLFALKDLVNQLKTKYGSEIRVIGHCEINEIKSCPNMNPDKLREFLTS